VKKEIVTIAAVQKPLPVPVQRPPPKAQPAKKESSATEAVPKPPQKSHTFAGRSEWKDAIKAAHHRGDGAEVRRLTELYTKETGGSLESWLNKQEKARKIAAKAAWRKVEKKRKK
jgi:hypothetical protein